MIYLIRHGQTEFNREDRVQGRVDSSLTGLGIAQASAMGGRLATLAAEIGGEWAVQTSPLGRARQTAAIVTRALGLAQTEVDERLAEVSYGDLEGLTRDEVDARWPELIGVNGIFGRAPGGESFEALAARVGAWLADAEARPDVQLVAVTHAGVIRTLRGLYLDLSLEEMRALDKPQDIIFRLADGQVERMAAAPLPSRPARR